VFDMSWSELLLIAIVALIVIGPKDLPRMVKIFASFARKARGLAREFQSGIEEMSREAELDSIKSEIDAAASTDFNQHIENTIDPGGALTKDLSQDLERANLDRANLDRQAADAANPPALDPNAAIESAAAPAALPAPEPAAPAEPGKS
jgi:sec-independent protein translocase protein TatB